ncbi:MAG: hypothetical protein HC828_15325 [Blastochloris sp.]|nr:hypothetical protein [Blastochloris sp.]
MQSLLVRSRRKQAATVLRYHRSFDTSRESQKDGWLCRIPHFRARHTGGGRHTRSHRRLGAPRRDLETLFDPGLVDFAGGPAALDFRTARTVEKGHGRLEERTITVRSLRQDATDWPYLRQVFQLTYRTTDMTTEKSARRYALASRVNRRRWTPAETAGAGAQRMGH